MKRKNIKSINELPEKDFGKVVNEATNQYQNMDDDERIRLELAEQKEIEAMFKTMLREKVK